MKTLHKNKRKKKLKSIQSKINRQEAIDQGFYDGRFRKRIIPNKKKELDKRNIEPYE